jgi:hypothetical protein
VGPFKIVGASPVNHAETPRNQIMTGFQTMRNMPRIWDNLQVAISLRAEAYIQVGGAHKEHLL